MVDEDGDRLICPTATNLIHCLSGSAGQLLWASQTASGTVLTGGRRVLLPGRFIGAESYPLGRNDLFALDLATGARIWTAPSAQDGDLGSNNYRVAGTASGLLWVRTQHGFACHAASDGQKLSDVYIGVDERGFGEVVPSNDGLFYVGAHLIRLVP